MFQFEKNALGEFLKNLNFPSNRQQLIDKAKAAGLPQQVLMLLQRLEDKPYNSAQEVEDNLHAHKA